MSEKELGQTAYDAAFDDVSPAFADAPLEIRYHWSVIETAVRNAALEEAAKKAKSYDHDRCVYDANGNVIPSRHGGKIAAAIRELKRKKDPDAEAPGQLSGSSPPGE